MSHQQHWDDLRVQTAAAVRHLRSDLEKADDHEALAKLSESAQIMAASISGMRRIAIDVDHYLEILREAKMRRGAA